MLRTSHSGGIASYLDCSRSVFAHVHYTLHTNELHAKQQLLHVEGSQGYGVKGLNEVIFLTLPK